MILSWTHLTSKLKIWMFQMQNLVFQNSWAEDNSKAEQADLNCIIGSGCKCVCITKIDVSPINDFLASPWILSFSICKSSFSSVRNKWFLVTVSDKHRNNMKTYEMSILQNMSLRIFVHSEIDDIFFSDTQTFSR